MGFASLDTHLSAVLKPKQVAMLNKAFGMATVGDLVSHYPRRYAHRGELTALMQLPTGEEVTIVAEVRDARLRYMKMKKGSIFDVRISDGTGVLTLTFFNQPWLVDQLVPGARGMFAGKVTDYRGTKQLTHPHYEIFSSDQETLADGVAADDTGATSRQAEERARLWSHQPIPVYPATGQLPSWDIQKLMRQVLDELADVDDPLPESVRRDGGFLTLRDAIEKIHRPRSDDDWQRARDTLRFHEAFVLQTALLERRAAARTTVATSRVATPGGYLERFDAALGFELTADQREVGDEITRDMQQSYPMSRLIQGEVGSGKTVVALRAMLAVADSGGQAALLAPTEVLAGQHLRSIARILAPNLAAELMPTLVTGQLTAGERRKALLRVVSGQAKIVIGTHALISEAVTFFDLGLVVVDEQHRFGVDQREALRQKGQAPHVLVLTATPIPRTVAMTVFGDLDISTIRELPAGRGGIQSFAVPVDNARLVNRVWQRMKEELELGRQAFVVCPAISPAESEPDAVFDDGGSYANVEAALGELRSNALFAEASIGALHGRMSSDEKDATMRAFASGEIDILVATTVIEVGVDVPNASIMVVLDAERFGVSQLHQLRGRIGRGGVPGVCLFVTQAPVGSVARERVEAVASTLDGFELAQVDLELRREGDVLGTMQSGGRSSLKLLRVARDSDVIARARAEAERVIGSDPELDRHPALKAALARRLDEAEREFLVKS